MRFEFTKQYHGTLYVYNSEDQILYVREEVDMYSRMQMTERQALRLLADIVYGTVKPLSHYFTGYGRDSVGTCVLRHTQTGRLCTLDRQGGPSRSKALELRLCKLT